MSGSSFQKFRKRLSLVDYMRSKFGLKNVRDQQGINQYFENLSECGSEYRDGRSQVCHHLLSKPAVQQNIGERLRIYDENVKKHTELLNDHRSDPIKLKYFQIFALLQTEYYLDRLSRNRNQFLDELNEFVTEQNEIRSTRIKLPKFRDDDLDKIAFWMATGSGKTLIMHINYYQFLHYLPSEPQNILLITPNEGLSRQHIQEMEKSGVQAYRFDNLPAGMYQPECPPVKVIEITKLVEEKTGEGVSVEVSSFEGRNLLFVDEGHKGTVSDSGAWRKRRKLLAESGFTFEYSATFGQAVGRVDRSEKWDNEKEYFNSKVQDISLSDEVEEEIFNINKHHTYINMTLYELEEKMDQFDLRQDKRSKIRDLYQNFAAEYGKSILFEYSYPRFYGDGYGKDYRILNLKDEINPELTNRYLLANVLSFFEQSYIYEKNKKEYFSEYNIAPPLLLLIGHTVNVDLSDVEKIIRFLDRFLNNDKGWGPESIRKIIEKETGIQGPDGRDLFSDRFQVLRDNFDDPTRLYQEILSTLFHVEKAGGIELVDIEGSEGEIGIRERTSDHYFSVINIGDKRTFLNRIEEEGLEVGISEDHFRDSLFKNINQRDSKIQMLIGARKFIEGWDSWRVSSMGLLNIGRGEGPQVIQMFGRGVRLLGKDQSLKRSRALDGNHPDHIQKLETLNIFGIRADYMSEFRDYLEDEGIDVEERTPIEIPTKRNKDFSGKGLKVVKPEDDRIYEEEVFEEIEVDIKYAPEIERSPVIEQEVSEELVSDRPASYGDPEEKQFDERLLPLLDWKKIYRNVFQYQREEGYTNLYISRDALREIIHKGYYHLYCPDEFIDPDEKGSFQSISDLQRVQRIVQDILRKYVRNYFRERKRKWENNQLEYELLDESDENIIDQYEARVVVTAEEVIDQLYEILEKDALYDRDVKIDGGKISIHLDPHLYVPLMLEDEEEIIEYSPPGLNRGEREFIDKLRSFIGSEEGMKKFSGKELYILRNQSRGQGVGFYSMDERVFPDFIVWIKEDDKQQIKFIEPHGLITGGDPEENPKIQLYNVIKEIEDQLNGDCGEQDVSLNSFVISRTNFSELNVGWSKQTFNDSNVFFRRQNYIEKIFSVMSN